jgi:hypothetical protein
LILLMTLHCSHFALHDTNVGIRPETAAYRVGRG